MASDRSDRHEKILDAVLPVVGQFGLKKSSVVDLARAAGLSKQGLYLHFDSKEELLTQAMERYFEEGLRLVEEALARNGVTLQNRLVDALDCWFGRHLEYFNPASLEVIQPGSSVAPGVEIVKKRVCRLLEEAIANAEESASARHTCTPAELSRVLFQFGLTWKEGHGSRGDFRKTLRHCVCACFPAPDSLVVTSQKRQ